MSVYIQKEVFNIEKAISNIRNGKSSIGAVVSFIGYVREFSGLTNKDNKINKMYLEHYPGMTEKELKKIELTAKSRWNLEDVCIIHRIGTLLPNDPIVAVIVASKHRKNAFEACEFIIDFLKTDAPFWKKEISEEGNLWVQDRVEDHQRKDNWKIEK